MSAQKSRKILSNFRDSPAYMYKLQRNVSRNCARPFHIPNQFKRYIAARIVMQIYSGVVRVTLSHRSRTVYILNGTIPRRCQRIQLNCHKRRLSETNSSSKRRDRETRIRP